MHSTHGALAALFLLGACSGGEREPATSELAVTEAPRGDAHPPIVAAPELLAPAPANREELPGARGPLGQASELAGSIDPATFDAQSFVARARTIAHAASPAEVEDWIRLADDPSITDAQRVVAAEVLRNVAPSETGEVATLSPRAVAALRRAWRMRAADPILARAAAPALGAFGEVQDRSEMLDVLRTSSSATEVALARAGLAASRGDAAALEMLAAAEATKEPALVDGVLCALTSMAGAEHGLSAEGRTQCAAVLGRMLASAGEGREPSARLRSTLAAMRSRPEQVLAGP